MIPAPPGDGNAMLAQILQEQGRQSTKLAVIDTKLDSLVSARDDHEERLRELRAEVPAKLSETIAALQAAQQQATGSRDTQARVTSWLAAAAAVGAGIAGYLHH